MAVNQFLAVSYKNKSFEALFSDTNINTFPYVLAKPEKQFVMAFKEEQLDVILGILNLTRENIVARVETERPNMILLKFDVPYEFGVNYESSVATQIQNVINPAFVEVMKKHRDIEFSVSYCNNINSLNSNWNYASETGFRLFVLTITPPTGSGGYVEYVDPTLDDAVAVKLMNNYLIPNYYAPDAVFKFEDGTPCAVIKGDKVLITALVDTNMSDQSRAAQWRSFKHILMRAADMILTKLKSDPGIMGRIQEMEKEYKFMEFLHKLVSKRSEGHIKRLKEVNDQIPNLVSQMASLVEEQIYLNTIVDAVNPEGEKQRLLKEISNLRKAEDIKDIAFDEDAIIINMKHVMFPHYEKKDTILHCGEMTAIIPFDAKKHLQVFRSHINHYPDKMRGALKKISCAHPNIFDNGELCYGNTAEAFGHLRGEFDISSLFIMINNFVHVYNPKSPTIDPGMFPTTSVEEAKKFYESLYPADKLGEAAPVISYSDPDVMVHSDYDDDDDHDEDEND